MHDFEFVTKKWSSIIIIIESVYNTIMNAVIVYQSLAELPFLSAHWTMLLHLLSCQPLQDAVHVETVTTVARNCMESIPYETSTNPK